MKILILANNDVGLFKFRKELLEQLIKEGHKVFVSVPDGEFVKDIELLGCDVIKTDISRRGTNPFEDLRLIFNYRKILKNIRPDIVFSYTIKPNIYGGVLCSFMGIPYVANITGLGTAVENEGALRIITVNMYKFALRKAQTVFFQNKENESFFEKYKIASGKHKIIPGSGVNLSYYEPIEYPDEKGVEFVFIARIMKEKGIDQYLEAAEYITDKYPNTKFHICGFCEPEYEGRLDSLAKSGVVTYHGMVRDVRTILKDVHCTVHPTYYPEGISNVLLESSACARPIITTDRSGCQEVIDDGINGYMIPQKDTKALINAIEKFLALTNEERKQMGLNGRLKVEKEFDRQIVINTYLQEI